MINISVYGQQESIDDDAKTSDPAPKTDTTMVQVNFGRPDSTILQKQE